MFSEVSTGRVATAGPPPPNVLPELRRLRRPYDFGVYAAAWRLAALSVRSRRGSGACLGVAAVLVVHRRIRSAGPALGIPAVALTALTIAL